MRGRAETVRSSTLELHTPADDCASVDAACDAVIYRYFASLTEQFLAPLNRYFGTLWVGNEAVAQRCVVGCRRPSDVRARHQADRHSLAQRPSPVARSRTIAFDAVLPPRLSLLPSHARLVPSAALFRALLLATRLNPRRPLLHALHLVLATLPTMARPASQDDGRRGQETVRARARRSRRGCLGEGAGGDGNGPAGEPV